MKKVLFLPILLFALLFALISVPACKSKTEPAQPQKIDPVLTVVPDSVKVEKLKYREKIKSPDGAGFGSSFKMAFKFPDSIKLVDNAVFISGTWYPKSKDSLINKKENVAGVEKLHAELKKVKASDLKVEIFKKDNLIIKVTRQASVDKNKKPVPEKLVYQHSSYQTYIKDSLEIEPPAKK